VLKRGEAQEKGGRVCTSRRRAFVSVLFKTAGSQHDNHNRKGRASDMVLRRGKPGDAAPEKKTNKGGFLNAGGARVRKSNSRRHVF